MDSTEAKRVKVVREMVAADAKIPWLEISKTLGISMDKVLKLAKSAGIKKKRSHHAASCDPDHSGDGRRAIEQARSAEQAEAIFTRAIAGREFPAYTIPTVSPRSLPRSETVVPTVSALGAIAREI
jgi:hypothetical protein